MPNKKRVKDKKIVCIIDDESLIVEMYSVKLKIEGFDVISACDGEKGLELIKEKKPEIILLDLSMPGMDGFEVMKNLKKNKQLYKIPVIILTNYDLPEMRKQACELGALFFVVKAQHLPSDIAKMVKEILAVKLKHPANLTCNKE
jgi:CheY-like chemotaxis protein